jgi:protein subunit release factor B
MRANQKLREWMNSCREYESKNKNKSKDKKQEKESNYEVML